MNGRGLEAKLVITAEDHTRKIFADIEARARAMAGRISGFSRGGSGLAQAPGMLEAERGIAHLCGSFREIGVILTRVAGDAERAARGLGDVSRAAHGVDRARHAGGATERAIAAGIIGGYAAHSAAHFAHVSLETYREFDKERRYGRAVMGISDDQQKPLVDQAISMGGTTRYNDIAVLEGQRDLAARGLHRDQILGMMPAAADLGQSMDLNLPDAVKQLEGAIFGFKKDISSTEAAARSARQTADLQVRAGKMSGMSAEDIRDIYKYGGTPARLSGVSEQFLLAFGGIGKKSNMAGNETGTAFRALMTAANAPTQPAKMAMSAVGMDFSKYQRPIPTMAVDPFVRGVAAQYGVRLNQGAVAALTRIFTDPKLINDPAAYTPAVVKALGGTLGKKDAKSLKSIAGMANRYRTASGSGVDVNAMLADLMTAMSKGKNGLALANAIFGPKQGGRIASALTDPETLKGFLDLLQHHSDGYATAVSDQRMAGFDGAMLRLEGATKILETSLGRAFDNDGKGGALTAGTDLLGGFVRSLAETSPRLQRLGMEAAAAAGILTGLKGAEALMSGFGLKTSAVALTGAAEALTAAAGRQALAAGLSLPGGKKTGATHIGNILKAVPVIGTAIVVGEETLGALDDAHRDEFGDPAHPRDFARPRRTMGGNAHRLDLLPRPPTDLPSMTQYGLGGHDFAAIPGPGGGKIEATVKPDQISAKVDGNVQGLVTIKLDVAPELRAAVAALRGGQNGNFKLNLGTSMSDTIPGARNNVGR